MSGLYLFNLQSPIGLFHVRNQYTLVLGSVFQICCVIERAIHRPLTCSGCAVNRWTSLWTSHQLIRATWRTKQKDKILAKDHCCFNKSNDFLSKADICLCYFCFALFFPFYLLKKTMLQSGLPLWSDVNSYPPLTSTDLLLSWGYNYFSCWSICQFKITTFMFVVSDCFSWEDCLSMFFHLTFEAY